MVVHDRWFKPIAVENQSIFIDIRKGVFDILKFLRLVRPYRPRVCEAAISHLRSRNLPINRLLKSLIRDLCLWHFLRCVFSLDRFEPILCTHVVENCVSGFNVCLLLRRRGGGGFLRGKIFFSIRVWHLLRDHFDSENIP